MKKRGDHREQEKFRLRSDKAEDGAGGRIWSCS